MSHLIDVALSVGAGVMAVGFISYMGNDTRVRHNCWLINFEAGMKTEKNTSLLEWQNKEMAKQNEYLSRPFHRRVWTGPPEVSKFIQL